MTRETAQEIDLAAAQWAARMDRGDLSGEERIAFQAWLDGDARRPGAYARMRAVALHTLRAKALGTGFDPEAFADTPKRPRPTRRGWMIGGIAAAASAAGIAGLGLAVGDQQWLSTRKGEMREVSLKDGTTITLNSATRLWVTLTRTHRAAYLFDGEAMFDVAHDDQRPFIVKAGDMHVAAHNGSFSVSRLQPDRFEMLVQRGQTVLSDGPRPARQVSANTHVVAAAGQAPVDTPVSQQALERALAWRSGRISFEGETLEQAAEAFQRYSDTRIVVAAPELRHEKIAGMFQATDPVGFARAVADSLDGNVVVGDNVVYIQRNSGV